jgi:hypothetical protein
VRALAVTVCLAAVIGVGCGSEEGAGPRGPAATVVGRAPAVTEAAGRAKVVSFAPGLQGDGSIDLRTGLARVAAKGPGAANPFVSDPALAIDVVRGAMRIETFGGVGVQGVGTMMYELDVDPAKALAAAPSGRRDRLAKVLPSKPFYADVFIDTQGRIRRVLLPVDLTVPRQYGDSKITNEEMTVDFFDFAGTK